MTAIVEDEGRVSGPAGFGALLRQHRLAAGLSQEDLAERARMSREGISALERGHRRTPQRETLALLAGALALSQSQRVAFEAAARSEPRPRYGSSVTIGPWLGAEASVLPLALTSFVGREAELVELAALVRQHRLVTVTGPGGVGKTQMALHVGTTLSEATDRAVCFITLAPIVDPSLVVTAIASALGLQEVPNHPIRETLVAYLKNKAMLLILDNCEHVLVEVRPVVDAVLRHCAGIAILATSRESLRVAGEQAYRLPSLSVPSPEAVHRVNASNGRTYAAIVLFADRAQAVDHRLALTDANAPIVAEICRRLDGIPLAIELAAARVNALSLRALANRLDDRFCILTGSVTPRRHQTMRATIDWSYDLLSPKEQRVLEVLSVFAGGCALVAAEAVCAGEEVAEGDVLDILSSLVDKSLLIAGTEGTEPRYRLLESFREYAREKLAMRGELDDALHRHALVFLELAEQLQLAFDSGPDEVWCTLVREELSNWRAALHWALTERGDVLLGQRLVGQLNVAWRTFARVEGRRWIALALELVDNRTPRSVLAGLAYCEATVSWQLREYQRSLTTCEDAITHYRTVGDSLGVAHAQAIATVARYFILLDRAIVVIVTHDRRPLANQPVKVRGTFSQLFGGSRRNEGPRELKSICVHL
ncbi:MAG: helix-turn-helix domain-containing protein [Candidatus Cybelea sp.]